MILTVGMLVVGFGLLFIAGIPITLFFFKEDESKEAFWALVPFGGFAFIALVLRTFVLFGLTIRQLAIPMMVMLVIVFAIPFLKKIKLPRMSAWIAAGALFVLLVNGGGYLVIGADKYAGYNAPDMLFYGTQPQLHMDYSISTTQEDIPFKPGYDYALTSKTHRISRSMLQAFVSVLVGTEAKNSLGFISVLGPVLIFFAMVFLTAHFEINKRWRIAACLFGACLPGVAQLHLEGFIGASVASPFMLLWIPMAYKLAEKPAIKTMILYAAILATAMTCYTEVSTVYVCLSVCVMVLLLFKKRLSWKGIAFSIGVLLLSLLVNIQVIHDLIKLGIPSSANMLNSLDHHYSFGFSIEGLVYMFFFKVPASVPEIAGQAIRIMAVLLFISSYIGLAWHALKNRNVITLTCIAACLAPFYFVSGNKEMLYNFYRIMLMVLPLFAVGIWYLGSEITKSIRDGWQVKEDDKKEAVIKKACIILFTAVFSGVFMYSAANSTLASMRITQKQNARADRYKINTEPAQAILKEMRNTKGKNLIFVAGKRELLPWWMAYEARNNNIWYISPFIDDTYAKASNPPNVDLLSVPLDSQIVWDPYYYCIVKPESQKTQVAAMFSCMNYKNSANRIDPTVFPVKGYKDNQYELRVFTRENITATLRLFVNKVNGTGDVVLNVKGFGDYPVETDGMIEISLDLKAGGTIIEMATASIDDSMGKQDAPIYVTDCQLVIH